MFIDIVSHSAEIAPLGATFIALLWSADPYLPDWCYKHSASNEAARDLTALFHRCACFAAVCSG